MIPLSIPNLSGNEWKYVKECLDTNFVSSVGKFVTQFEEEFAKYLGSESAIAIVNGTASIHIALTLSDVEHGDEVFAPNLTFIAPLNAIKYLGARPILLDCEWDTLGIDPVGLETFLNDHCSLRDGLCINNKTGRRIKALILVHVFGHTAKVRTIKNICERFNIKLIEDASESLGSKSEGQMTGTIGDFGCFSFNGNKIMTSGGGGMLIARDNELAKKAKHLTTTAKKNGVHFDHDEVGYNYRMVNVLAAIGLAQLELLPGFLIRKQKNFEYYQKQIEKIDNVSLFEPKLGESNHWFYALILNKNFPLKRDEMMKVFTESGIDTRPVWMLMNELPMYKNCQNNGDTIAKEIREKVINIPCSTGLQKSEIDMVVETISKASK